MKNQATSMIRGIVAAFLMSDAGSSSIVSKWVLELFDDSSSAELHEHFSWVTFVDGQTSKPPVIERLPLLVAVIHHEIEPYVPPCTGGLVQKRSPQKIESLNLNR